MRNGRPMEVYLAQPRGFCAGVVRAIEIVERALEKYGPPVYVRHEIVTTNAVVESLKNKGAILVEDSSEVLPGTRSPCSAPMAWRGAWRRKPPPGACWCSTRPPPGDQGPQPGQALYGQRPGADPDRPCRPPRGREGTMGQVPGPVTLVQNVDDVALDLDASCGYPGRLYHPDHAQRRRHQGYHCGASGAFYRHSKARTSGISAMRHRTANLR